MSAEERDGQGAGLEQDGGAAQSVTGQGSPGVPARTRRERRWLVNALVVVTTALLVVGIFATWANRLLFSPDNWSATSTQLLQNPNVRSTTANYVVTQIYNNINVEHLLKSGLPKQFKPLAGPAAGALRNVAVQGVDVALTRPRVQSLWAQANRAAAQTFVNIVHGGNGVVATDHGAVSLKLGPIVENAAAQLGLPSGLSSKLPPNVATLTVFRSNQLAFLQNIGNAIQGLALWLTILVPLLYALALWLTPSGHRRRTLMTIGFAGVFAGVLILLLRSILANQVAGALTQDASLQLTIRDVYAIATAILSDVAGGVIAGGAVLIVAAWFAGPARPARSSRHAIAPFLREHAGPTYAIALGVMVLIFIWNPISATGKPAGILVFTALALFGTYILIRQTNEEFPDAQPGHATHAIRTRLSNPTHRRHQPNHPPPATTAEQLKQLADLRDQGALTPEEYQTAKTKLLE